jgi:glycosyltransferase involved in cell wall biosynthesis
MVTVLNVAYPLAPVGVDAAGGAEQVLSTLDRAAVARGHESLVIAPAGSRVAGELIPLPPVPAQLDETARRAAQAACADLVAAVCRDRAPDVVHLHGIDCDSYLPPADIPTVVTLHLPPAWYAPRLFSEAGPRAWFVSVSATEQRTAPAVRRMRTIVNGVDVERLPRIDVDVQRYTVTLGRVCPEKGFHLALDAAARAGIPLIAAGRVFPYPAHVDYFEREIAPRLRTTGARWLGPVGLARKRRLLSSAQCLIVASLVEETSSLVAMEALACGTPVVARRSGALPEIVENGKTGFVVDDEPSMARAIADAAALDRTECRRAAVARFDARRMASEYLALYEECARVGSETMFNEGIRPSREPALPARRDGDRARP